MTAQLILSASRRTDLPGFYPEWTAAKIRRVRRPIHSVFFWTKHPQAFTRPGPLRDLVGRDLANSFILLTVTGLGGTRIEPRVPAWKDAVRAAAEAVALLGGQGRRIRWRFDPLLPGVGAAGLFSSIAPRIRDLGITDCILSLPASMSLKGELQAQYREQGIGLWDGDEAHRLVEALVEEAGRLSLELFSCATPRLERWTGGVIKPAACISSELASAMHPEGLGVAHVKDPAQRKRCTCTRSEDIGSYTLTPCRSGCLYCYSKAGGPNAGGLPGCAAPGGTP
jgi:hypothetical protein